MTKKKPSLRIELILIIWTDKSSKIRHVGVHADMVQSSESPCATPGERINHRKSAGISRNRRQTSDSHMFRVAQDAPIIYDRYERLHRILKDLIKSYFVSSFFARAAEMAAVWGGREIAVYINPSEWCSCVYFRYSSCSTSPIADAKLCRWM